MGHGSPNIPLSLFAAPPRFQLSTRVWTSDIFLRLGLFWKKLWGSLTPEVVPRLWHWRGLAFFLWDVLSLRLRPLAVYIGYFSRLVIQDISLFEYSSNTPTPYFTMAALKSGPFAHVEMSTSLTQDEQLGEQLADTESRYSLWEAIKVHKRIILYSTAAFGAGMCFGYDTIANGGKSYFHPVCYLVIKC